ncbi:MAG: hypothetical protein NC392_11195 [Roseburia sp.]|nr:hypothetical protein [Roseburia sp.]
MQLHKELEILEETNSQYRKIERRLEQLEDDILWQNRRRKELNDDLFESYPQDRKLQQILAGSEELLGKQISRENSLFQECRENLHEMKKQAEQQMDDCREELQRIQKEKNKEGEHNEDNHNDHYV